MARARPRAAAGGYAYLRALEAAAAAATDAADARLVIGENADLRPLELITGEALVMYGRWLTPPAASPSPSGGESPVVVGIDPGL